jgi:hypothetical protein
MLWRSPLPTFRVKLHFAPVMSADVQSVAPVPEGLTQTLAIRTSPQENGTGNAQDESGEFE